MIELMKVGDRKDLLLLIEIVPSWSENSWRQRAIFRCDCGNEVERGLRAISTPAKNTRSCGCVKRKKTGGLIVNTPGFDFTLAQKFYLGRL